MTKPSPLPSSRPPIAVAGLADRLDLLETFVRIVESGSLSAAARVLRTTQPTVSRRLQQLERLLGVQLLHRSTHGLRTSEAGDRCYRHAQEVLAGWAFFQAGFQGENSEPEGRLRVVVPHAFGQQLLVGPVAEYLRRHARMEVDWLLHDHLPDFIAEGVDCAILVGEARDPSVVAVKVADVARIVVAAPGLVSGAARPRRVEDLAKLPWLALKTYYLREVELTHQRTGRTVRVPIRPRFSTDNLFAVCDAARRGLGVAVVSAWLPTPDLAQGRLVQLVPEWQARSLPVQIVYPLARHQPPKLRRFVEIVRELVPSLVKDLSVHPSPATPGSHGR